MRRVVVWASGRGWAEDGMARAICEDGGDLCSVEGPASLHPRPCWTRLVKMTWGPIRRFIFQKYLSHYGTKLLWSAFCVRASDKSGSRAPRKKEGLGDLLVIGKETCFFPYLLVLLLATSSSNC